MPVRIQLSRRKGWRMPGNTVKVDRRTDFGNPFVIGARVKYLNGEIVVRDAAHSVELFRHWCGAETSLGMAARRILQGKNLACWCTLCDRHAAGRPFDEVCETCAPCHADVLLELANPKGQE